MITANMALTLFGALTGAVAPQHNVTASGDEIEASAMSADGTSQATSDEQVSDDPNIVEYTEIATLDGARREFSYAWPEQANSIPELVEELEADRRSKLAEQIEYWMEAVADCPTESNICRQNSYEMTWQVVTDHPRFLSLSSNFYSYSGGAHGNHGRDSLLWDREAGRSLSPLEMFAPGMAFDNAIGAAACAALNRERAERRGEAVPRGATEWPNQCVSRAETVLFLGSTNGGQFDRIGIYYAPYTAGAYAEGDFELTLPVTSNIIRAIKPEYRAAFVPAK